MSWRKAGSGLTVLWGFGATPNETIPVCESIDGGEYQRIGAPRTAIANVKEGSVVPVYHNYKTEADEFYLFLACLKKKK